MRNWNLGPIRTKAARQMSTEHEQDYDDALVALLERVWGEGYLSPGGPEEVAMILDGIDLRAKTVLDIGCGAGAIDVLLAEKYQAGKVIGIDVDPSLIERCEQRASKAGIEGRVEFRCVDPGPLPFDDGGFDAVFSKDSIIHIEDKHAIFAEIFRVLRPGGMFAASDWMRGEGEVSEELQYYIDMEGLGFGMGSAKDYRSALQTAGFTDIGLTNRNAWYREVAHREHTNLSGTLYEKLVGELGAEFTDHEIEVWRAMTVVLDRGELLPTHIRATRPA